jgi:hypothetical protein
MNDPSANPIGEDAYKDMKKYSFNRPCGWVRGIRYGLVGDRAR